MAKPTININMPIDAEEIGQGAQRIRETRKAIYEILPINPEDLNYNVEGNWWPAGSLTGGMDPEVVDETKPPYSGMQDRAFLIGDNALQFDYTIPNGKNAITPGPLTIGDVTVTVPENSTWTIVGEEDIGVQYLRDLADVEAGASVTDQDALLWQNDTQMWKPGPAPVGPPGPPGPGFNFEGTVPTKEDIPGWPDSYNGKVGDVYVTEDNDHIWAWSGDEWYDVGPMGQKGKGWTGGSYDSATGITTFTSDDGLGFSTTDIRGAKGDPGAPFDPSGNYTVNGTWNFTNAGNTFKGDGSGLTNLPDNSKTYDIGVSGTDIVLNDSDGGTSTVLMDGGSGITISNLAGQGLRISSDGMDLSNTQPWTYGQYNAQAADAAKAGSGISTRYSWDAQQKPVMSLSDNSAPTYIASPYAPTVNGMFISITWVSYGGGQVWTLSDDFDSKLGPPEDTGENVTRVFHSRFGKWCDVA